MDNSKTAKDQAPIDQTAESNNLSEKTDEKSQDFISVVMVTNDGEIEIEEALKSIRQFVGEVIFVDTGSDKKVLEIATEHKCNIFKYELKDDLGEARNFGIKKAKNDWILILDGDEVADPDALFKLSWLIKNTKNSAFFLEIHDLKSGIRQPQLRFFRNDGKLKYIGGYGEYLDKVLEEDLPEDYFANSSAIIYNQRRRDRRAEVKRYENRIRLIKKLLLREPKNKYLLTRLGMDCEFVGHYKDAISYYKEVIENDTEGLFPLAARNLAICLEYSGKYENALNLLAKALKFYPDYTDLGFEAGMIYLKMGEFDMAIRSFNNCIELKDSPIYYPSIPGTGGVLAEFGIALCGQAQGRSEEAGYVMMNAMESIQESSLQLLYLGRILIRMYDNGNAKEIFLKIANLDNEGVQRIYKDLFGVEETEETGSGFGSDGTVKNLIDHNFPTFH